MEDENQEYEIPDFRQLEECYVNQSTHQNDCVDASNYETLTRIRAEISVYEQPQQVRSDNKSSQLTVSGNKESTSKNVADSVAQIEWELIKTKRCLISVGFLMTLFILVSLAAAALAAITYWQNTQLPLEMSRAQVGQFGQGTSTAVNYSQMINALSIELQQLHSIINESMLALSGDIKHLTDQARNNYSYLLTEIQTTQRNVTELVTSTQSMLNESSQALNTNLSHLVTQSQNNFSEILNTLAAFQTDVADTQDNVTRMEFWLNTIQTEVTNLQSSVVDQPSKLCTSLCIPCRI